MSLSRMACLALFTTVAASAGALPLDVTLAHSGYLLDASDAPITAPAQSLTFHLYDETSTIVWSATCVVSVREGYYTARLGTASCGAGLNTAHLPPDATRSLEVVVGGTVLSPRLTVERLPAAAVAVTALDAAKVGGVSAGAFLDTATGKVLASALPPLRDAQVAPDAAIAASKIAGLGTLATRSAIADADVASGAAISASKISGLGALAALGSVSDGQVSPGAAIAVSKLAPGANNQVLSTVGGAATWTTLAGSLGYTPVNAAGDTMTGALGLPPNGLAVGTAQLVVSAGQVGVGTSAPATRLHVLDTTDSAVVAQVVGANTGTGVGIYSQLAIANQNTNANTTVGLALRHANAAGSLKSAASIDATLSNVTAGGEVGALRFSTMNAGSVGERVRIDGAGNVGIGTAAPIFPLHVSTSSAGFVGAFLNSAGNAGVRFKVNDATDSLGLGAPWRSAIWGSSSESLAIVTNNTTALVVDTAQNVGIGTTAPGSRLEVRNGRIASKTTENTDGGFGEHVCDSQPGAPCNFWTGYGQGGFVFVHEWHGNEMGSNNGQRLYMVYAHSTQGGTVTSISQAGSTACSLAWVSYLDAGGPAGAWSQQWRVTNSRAGGNCRVYYLRLH